LKIDIGSGWALDARSAFGCTVGAWCPYACASPYIETQYDNLLGQVRHLLIILHPLFYTSLYNIHSLRSRGNTQRAAQGKII
jgi:hypothetical protein